MDYISESTTQIEDYQFDLLTLSENIEGIDEYIDQLMRDFDEFDNFIHYPSKFLIHRIPHFIKTSYNLNIGLIEPMPDTPPKDVVNKEVVRGCKKKFSVFTRDQLAESPKISKFVKDFIKTRDDGSPEKIEAVVDWIEDTFQFSNLCEADKRKLLPIVIYFLFKSKYETMLRKM